MLAAVIKTKNKTKSKDEDLNQNREAVDVVLVQSQAGYTRPPPSYQYWLKLLFKSQIAPISTNN